MAVTLYTSRIILQVLGIEDFGIYNVVAGVVLMFGFLNNAMTAAVQRFVSFELGRNDVRRLHTIFSMSVSIHILIGSFGLIVGRDSRTLCYLFLFDHTRRKNVCGIWSFISVL